MNTALITKAEFIATDLREYTEIDEAEGCNPDCVKVAFAACDVIADLVLAHHNMAMDIQSMKDALEKCQRVLVMLVDPQRISASSVVHAYAHCVEAEAAARKALSGLD